MNERNLPLFVQQACYFKSISLLMIIVIPLPLCCVACLFLGTCYEKGLCAPKLLSGHCLQGLLVIKGWLPASSYKQTLIQESLISLRSTSHSQEISIQSIFVIKQLFIVLMCVCSPNYIIFSERVNNNSNNIHL